MHCKNFVIEAKRCMLKRKRIDYGQSCSISVNVQVKKGGV